MTFTELAYGLVMITAYIFVAILMIAVLAVAVYYWTRVFPWSAIFHEAKKDSSDALRTDRP